MHFKEKRKAVRIPSETLIAYSCIKEDGSIDEDNYGYVHCRNISLIGILFTAFEPVEIDTVLQLRLRLDLDDDIYEDINITSKVVRCEKFTTADVWNIAVCITSMLEEKQRSIFLKWLADKDDEYHQE